MGVSSRGTLTTVTKGRSLVTAADKKNTAHYDQVEVSAIPAVFIVVCVSICVCLSVCMYVYV